MARTTEMRLIELMSLKRDIQNVIHFLGEAGNFQFQSRKRASKSENEAETANVDGQFFDSLQSVRSSLEIADAEAGELRCGSANDDDRNSAKKIIASCDDLESRIAAKKDELVRVTDSYKEALSFSNLQIPYSKLQHLSFITLKIGKISSENFNALREAVGSKGVVVPLGDDSSKILAASSRQGKDELEAELKKFGFVNLEIPEDFKGIPADVLKKLAEEKNAAEKALADLYTEKKNFADTHKDEILRLLKAFSVSKQISDIQDNLESTSMVYRITGWVPASECRDFMKKVDELTSGRVAIREYLPTEVASVINGEEKVPVKLTHGKVITAFERMIFSYGSPLYGTIDPTPFVAVFFTLLFGIMFGDFGQGMCFLILGILMALKVVKVGGWNKFAPVFMAIGCSSCIMGLVTGEFFGTEEVLVPFARFVTGLFGTPRAPILKVMPSADPSSVLVIFGIFGATIAVGIVINSVGVLVNIFNSIIKRRLGNVFFGKCGLAGLVFYWYVLSFGIRIAAFHHSPETYDWIVIGLSLFFAAFGEPFERLFNGERPVLENGLGSAAIGGVVELIEVVSSYLSSTLSFVRVGAFALAHAVLGFIIEMMSEKCGPVGGIGVLIVGNAIVVVLEGMIVAIQVIRLQYYEFFSKFFNETGAEFKPLQFHYGNK